MAETQLYFTRRETGLSPDDALALTALAPDARRRRRNTSPNATAARASEQLNTYLRRLYSNGVSRKRLARATHMSEQAVGDRLRPLPAPTPTPSTESILPPLDTPPPPHDPAIVVRQTPRSPFKWDVLTAPETAADPHPHPHALPYSEATRIVSVHSTPQAPMAAIPVSLARTIFGWEDLTCPK